MPGPGIEPGPSEEDGILRCRRPIRVPNEWVRIDAFRRKSDEPGCRLQRFLTAFGASFLPVSCQYRARRPPLFGTTGASRGVNASLPLTGRLIRIVRLLLATSVNHRNQIGFDSGLGRQTFIPNLNRPQVAEAGYCGSNKAVSVERNSFRKEQVLEPLALIERRLHPQVGGAR